MPLSNRKKYLIKLTWNNESRMSINFSCNNLQGPLLTNNRVTFIDYKLPKLVFEVLNMKKTTWYFLFHWGIITPWYSLQWLPHNPLVWHLYLLLGAGFSHSSHFLHHQNPLTQHFYHAESAFLSYVLSGIFPGTFLQPINGSKNSILN